MIIPVMTIYKHKLENDVQPKNSDKEAAAVLTDDDEVCTLRVRIHDKLQVSVLTCFTCN